MNEDTLDGAVKQTTGRLQNSVGDLTRNDGDQAKGKIDEISGKAQSTFGKAKDKAGDYYGQVTAYAKKEPTKALAAAAAVGLLFGFVLRRR